MPTPRSTAMPADTPAAIHTATPAPTPTPRLAPHAAAFYATQSPFSDPGDLAPYYAGLPTDPTQLAHLTRDLMIHRLEGPRYGHTVPQDRLHHDAESRYLDTVLRLIADRDPAPLTTPRPFADRFVGVCRDFALLHCSLLRHAGVPARIRSGFADYFVPAVPADAFWADHVVTEYWDPARGWLLADAQLVGTADTAPYDVDFDPMDVPRDRFLVAGAAWRAIRAGGADPGRFGLDRDVMTGEWFVVGNVRLDLAALNKAETLLWDIWGEGASNDAGMTDAIRTLYDEVAGLTCDDVPFDAVRELYAHHDGLRLPATVLCLAPFLGPHEVALRGRSV